MTTTLTATAPPFAVPDQHTASFSPTETDRESHPRFSFDPVALTKKYDEEREKRLQQQNTGLGQYRAVDGELSYMLKDPYVQQRLERDPIKESCEVAIIGGGFGAQLVAVEMQKAGISDIKIIEKGGDFGGTCLSSSFRLSTGASYPR